MLIENKNDTTKKEHDDKPTTHKCKHCTAETSGNNTDEKNNMTFDDLKGFLSTIPGESIKRQAMQILNDRMFNLEHPIPLGSRAQMEKQPTESIRTNMELLHKMINAGMFEHVCMIPIDLDALMKGPQPVEKKPVEKKPVEREPSLENKTTMAMMRCDRIMIDDVKMIAIKEFIGFLGIDDLPEEYMMGRPVVGLEEDTITEYLLIQPTDDVSESIVLKVGDNITYKKYVELLRIMSAAGQRLTDINAKAKRARAFSGEFVVTI